MNLISAQSIGRMFALSVLMAIIIALSSPEDSFIGRVEAGGKGKGKGKGGNIIISTGGGGGGGSYNYPVPIPIPIHCDGGKSYWRRRRR